MHYGVNIKCDIHVNIISYNFSVKYAMQKFKYPHSDKSSTMRML